MSQSLIEQVEARCTKPDADIPNLEVGDTIDVHTRIVEGNKERIQAFGGVVIAIKGRGINQNITVRRIVANEGVERIFPLHSPRVASIEIKRKAQVRRSRLYFLRDRVGKARRLPDRRRGPHAAARQKRKKA